MGDTKYRPNSFRNPLFQGEAAASACMKELCEKWQVPLGKLLGAIKDGADEHVRSVVHERRQLSGHFSRAVIQAWKDYWRDIQNGLIAACDKEKKREFDFGTMNHYLTAKFQTDTLLPEQCLARLIAGMEKQQQNGYGQSTPSTMNAQQITQRWKEVRAAMEKEYEQKAVHEQQRERVFLAVKAQWSVEHKTFIDNILKTVRDQVVHGKKRFAQDMCLDENLRKNAVEDTSTQERRVRAKTTIQKLRDCLREIDQI